MPMYRETAGTSERAKAIAGVLLVHAAMGAVILSGLTVTTVTRAVDRLQTFEIIEPPPPPLPLPPPPPSPRPEQAREPEGAPAVKAKPTPVVIPPPKVVIPDRPTVVAAKVPATGNASSAGAAQAGTGTGAGGTGSGSGGGGRGGSGNGGGGETPALLLTKIPHRDYRAIAGQRLPHGRATLAVRVNPDGRASNCRIARSSGDAAVDGSLCSLAERRLRFRPALDRTGRPISQDIVYTAVWQPF